MSGIALIDAFDAAASVPATSICVHCGLPARPGQRFCCAGCDAAYATIQGLGLGRYYERRLLDAAARPPRPETAERWDLARYITTDAAGSHHLDLAVEGVQCGACVWLIENVLAREATLLQGRVNMTTRRLHLAWRGAVQQADHFVAMVERLGYRLVPFDASCLAARDPTGQMLLRALAVAGFAAGNVMLSSAAIWIGLVQNMGPATRDLLHWISALIAMPAIAYAGQPFFRSAFAALRHGRTNMDVPVSIGVCIVTGLSLVETMQGAEHTYFDSAATLLFFLLVGRVLDHRARGRARATAEQLLTLRATDVAVVLPDGTTQRRAQQTVAPGDRVLVASGERVGVDGVVETGDGRLDASLVTGESLPLGAPPGTPVFAGMINLGTALTLRTSATGESTLLAECVRLIEAAEARRGRFMALTDRIARFYTPVVHLCALTTLLLWWLILGAPFGGALLNACAVLIVTCPCALVLAVPAAQVISTGFLFSRGILLKSATALERLAQVDTVIFDKTGTLTQPQLALADAEHVDPASLRLAASLAVNSRHPLARALTAAAGAVLGATEVTEIPGQGLACGDIRLGSARFAGAPQTRAEGQGPELWLARPGHAPYRFGFAERLRPDAAATLATLRRFGLRILLASGDGEPAVARAAAALGITEFKAGCSPVEKLAWIERLRADGRHVLMVGDGLNDGPSLAAADVSLSPATAADISQTVADVVFQGASLAPVALILRAARRTRGIMRENIILSIGYNLIMVPLAIAGFVTPWLAAAAMSLSSLTAMANSFRARVKP